MRKAKGSGFKMRSGNKTSFKMMGGSSPVKNAAQQAADRQAQIAAFNAAGGLSQAQNYNPTTGQFDFSSPGAQAALYNSLGNISVSNMYDPSSQVFLNELNWDGSMDLPNNEVNSENSISSDLQKELTDKLQEEEGEEYNPDAYQGSLYDYSVRKRTPMSKKRSVKGKRGYKMKRK